MRESWAIDIGLLHATSEAPFNLGSLGLSWAMLSWLPLGFFESMEQEPRQIYTSKVSISPYEYFLLGFLGDGTEWFLAKPQLPQTYSFLMVGLPQV